MNTWIPITERLPQVDRSAEFWVVVEQIGGRSWRSIHKAWWYPGGPADPDLPDDWDSEPWWEVEGYVDYATVQPFAVTHWMEMPALPEEEGK